MIQGASDSVENSCWLPIWSSGHDITNFESTNTIRKWFIQPDQFEIQNTTGVNDDQSDKSTVHRNHPSCFVTAKTMSLVMIKCSTPNKTRCDPSRIDWYHLRTYCAIHNDLNTQSLLRSEIYNLSVAARKLVISRLGVPFSVLCWKSLLRVVVGSVIDRDRSRAMLEACPRSDATL